MPNTPKQLAAENAELRARLKEAEETLRAIRHGEVDALVMSGTEGDHILTLKGAQEPYRVMVEAMAEGAVTVSEDGTILYCNGRFAERIKMPLEQIVGLPLQGMLAGQYRKRFEEMLVQGAAGEIREALMLQEADGSWIPSLFSMSPLPHSSGKVISVLITDLSDVVAATEARSRLALIVDSSDDAIVSIDLNGKVESWNRAAEELFGYTSEEALGHSIQSLIVPPGHLDEVIHEFEAIGRGARTLLADTVRQRKDGTPIEVSIKASPILDDAGKVVGASINSRDISAHKHAEQAAHDYENQLHSITDSAQDAILMLDNEGKISYWNAAAEKIFGYPASEAIGQPMHDLLAPERFQNASRKGYSHFREIGEGPIVGKTVELSGLRKDGTEFPIELSLSAVKLKGQWNAIGIIRDITERRQAEEAIRASRDLLRSVVENAPMRIFWKDRELTYLGCNTAFARDAGMSKPEDLYGKDDFQMGWKDQAELYRTDDREVLESGMPKLGIEEPQTTPDGQTIWLRTSKVPLRDRTGKITGLLGLFEDITALRRDRQALRQERDFSNGLIDTAQVAILVLDTDGHIMRLNRFLEELSGYTFAEVKDKSWFDVFLPEHDREQLRSVFDIAIMGKPTVGYVNAIVTRDGEESYLEWYDRPLQDDTGNLIGLLSVGVDITARRQAEEALSVSEKRFRSLFEQSAIGLSILSSKGNWLEVNDKLCAILGYSREALLEMNYHSITHTDHVARDAVRVEEFIAGELECGDWDKRLLRGDGTVIWARITISLAQDAMGKPEYFVLVIEDITDRKLGEAELDQHRQHLEELVTARTDELATAEARTRLILDSSADGLCGVDQQGFITFINPMACQLLGYRPEEVLGRTIHELIHHHYPDGTIFPEAQCPINIALREGKIIRDNDTTFWRSDGQPLSVSLAVHPMYEKGQVVGAVVSFFDNSFEKAAEVAKTLALEEAERLATVRSKFLANMSHEIRTPLNGVLGFAQIGLRESKGRRVLETFGRIIDSGQLLLGIVNDVLDFSKIDAGKLVLEQGVVDLAGVVGRVAAMLRVRAEEKDIDFHIEMAPDLPARCRGDGLRLSQVLTNLLTNAIKFTPRGRVSLTAAREDDHLVFRVIDTGIGMQPGQVARLFEPFEQADSSTTRNFGGTGLGLVISKRLVDLMNGNISVQSEPGAGSTFEVRIPLLDAEGHIDMNRRHEPEPLGRFAERRLDGLSLLVAEDNEVNRLVLKQMLDPEGCRLTLVGDGHLAVEAVRKSGATGFDLALMDIQMPELDGYAATRQIHEIAPGLPVIALTAHAMMEERERSLDAGMVAHVAKPVEIETLVTAILTALGHDVMVPPEITASAVSTEVTSEDVSIDWDALSSCYRDEPQFLPQLLATLLSSSAERPAKIREAATSASAGDFSALLTLLHSLKGMAGHVLPGGIRSHIFGLETLAKEGNADCVALAGTLADEVEAMLQDIRVHLAEFAPPVETKMPTAGDWARIAELVSQLEPLVGCSDTHAITLFKEERPLFENLLGKTARTLGRHLELFEFDSARADLTEVKTVCQQHVKQQK